MKNKIDPKISIIFPLFNGEKFLKRNLDSIRNLPNLENLELVIIDNNSNDSGIKVIESYNKYLNIKLIKNNKNMGFAKACNLGASMANGLFIFITNQDVIFPKDFFQELMNIYKEYKKSKEIIISPAVIFEGDGIHYFGAKIHFLGFSYTPDVLQKLPKNKIVKTTQRITGCTLFMKKKLFLDIGGFDSTFFMYCEDTDISLRLIRQGFRIYTSSNPYLIHQKHKWTFSDFQYYLLERNRFIAFAKNINNFKKLIPYFILSEVILLFHSIIIKKFALRIRIYYELLSKFKLLKILRRRSKKEFVLIPYQKLSKTLDPNLLGDLKEIKALKIILKFFNYLLKTV